MMRQGRLKARLGGARARAPRGRALLVAAVLLFAAAPREALAYIDPGTGGMLVQLLLGGIAGLLVILRLYWHRFKSLFARRRPGRSESGGASGPEA